MRYIDGLPSGRQPIDVASVYGFAGMRRMLTEYGGSWTEMFGEGVGSGNSLGVMR